MARASLIKENVKLLVNGDPSVKDNYNLLAVRYWEKFELLESIQDISQCTPVESITRAFRALVKSGEVELSEKTKKARKQKQKEFEKEYTQHKI